MSVRTQEQVAVAGSGAIACGLAATVAARLGDVLLLARSEESATRGKARVEKTLERLDGDGSVRVATSLDELEGCTFVVEAIVEDLDSKRDLLGRIGDVAGPDAVLATTTSSLSVEKLAEACGHPQRFVGLHVFNPVPRMELIELIHAERATEETRQRARDLCEALGKRAVEVPDTPGFVVNRLLFPFLFDAVRVLEETGLEPQAVDTCMKLGAAHPMGPLALLDFVGLDVSAAIGDSIGTEVPSRVRELIDQGALGKKAGRGFYDY